MGDRSYYKNILSALKEINRWGDTFAMQKKVLTPSDEIEQISKELRKLESNALHIEGNPTPEPDDIGLKGKQLTELKQLRYEKKKWDSSIEFAVKLTSYCGNIGRPITRKEAKSAVSIKIPETTFDKIWKCLPQGFKSRGGRPKKI